MRDVLCYLLFFPKGEEKGNKKERNSSNESNSSKIKHIQIYTKPILIPTPLMATMSASSWKTDSQLSGRKEPNSGAG